MIRQVYPEHANQEEANRRFSEAINNLIDSANYFGVNNVTDSQDVSVQFGFYFADATSGAITLTVPPARPHTGKGWTFKKTDSSVNTVTVSSASDIDGASTKVLSAQHAAVSIISDGDVWRVVSEV